MRIISAIALMRFWSTTLSELNYHVTRFILSAPDIRHLPSDTGIEVAFAGRSNAEIQRFKHVNQPKKPGAYQ